MVLQREVFSWWVAVMKDRSSSLPYLQEKSFKCSAQLIDLMIALVIIVVGVVVAVEVGVIVVVVAVVEVVVEVVVVVESVSNRRTLPLSCVY
jgi:hypothetical protein